jgi:hypothetical protein
MKISNSTARNWRNKGLIAYSQIECKIYYKVKDIVVLINNNYYSYKIQFNSKKIKIIIKNTTLVFCL